MTQTYTACTFCSADNSTPFTIPAGPAFVGVAVVLAAVAAAWGYATRRATKALRESERALAAQQKAGAAKLRPASGSLPADALRQAADHAMARSEDRLSSLTAAAEHENAAVLQGLRLPRPEVTYLPTQPAAFRG